MDPRERRASQRQPIKLAAQIHIGSDAPLPCQIADFCAEGLFVRYSGETSGKLDHLFHPQPPNELVVRFRSADGSRRHDLHVAPVRRIDGAMGVQLTRPNLQALEDMLEMCGSDGHQERSALKAPNDQVQFVLHQSARAIIRHIEPLLANCCSQVTEALRQAAQAATSDQLATEDRRFGTAESAPMIHQMSKSRSRSNRSPTRRRMPVFRWWTRTSLRTGWRSGDGHTGGHPVPG